MSAANPYADALVGTLWEGDQEQDEPLKVTAEELLRMVTELIDELKWEGVDHDGDM